MFALRHSRSWLGAGFVLLLSIAAGCSGDSLPRFAQPGASDAGTQRDAGAEIDSGAPAGSDGG
jgi:hypothetical protein